MLSIAYCCLCCGPALPDGVKSLACVMQLKICLIEGLRLRYGASYVLRGVVENEPLVAAMSRIRRGHLLG